MDEEELKRVRKDVPQQDRKWILRRRGQLPLKNEEMWL